MARPTSIQQWRLSLLPCSLLPRSICGISGVEAVDAAAVYRGEIVDRGGGGGAPPLPSSPSLYPARARQHTPLMD